MGPPGKAGGMMDLLQAGERRPGSHTSSLSAASRPWRLRSSAAEPAAGSEAEPKPCALGSASWSEAEAAAMAALAAFLSASGLEACSREVRLEKRMETL